jgi:hypothetical protein
MSERTSGCGLRSVVPTEYTDDPASPAFDSSKTSHAELVSRFSPRRYGA